MQLLVLVNVKFSFANLLLLAVFNIKTNSAITFQYDCFLNICCIYVKVLARIRTKFTLLGIQQFKYRFLKDLEQERNAYYRACIAEFQQLGYQEQYLAQLTDDLVPVLGVNPSNKNT